MKTNTMKMATTLLPPNEKQDALKEAEEKIWRYRKIHISELQISIFI